MAQHDLVLDNQSRTLFRADLNNALTALGTTMKGAAAPPNPAAGMLWIEDDTPSSSIWTLRLYDGADWLAVATIDTVGNVVQWAGGSTGSFSTVTATTVNATTLTGNGAGITALAGSNITDGTVAVSKISATGTPGSSTYLRGDGAWAAVAPGGPTQATAVAATSGTSIDFTGIPSTAKRITVMLAGVSTSGASNPTIRIGDSGGVETTGYSGAATIAGGGAIATVAISSGFVVYDNAGLASNVYSGSLQLSLVDTNRWVAQGVFGNALDGTTSWVGGSKTLSDTLDRVRVTTSGGTDTFDAGVVNIIWD